MTGVVKMVEGLDSEQWWASHSLGWQPVGEYSTRLMKATSILYTKIYSTCLGRIGLVTLLDLLWLLKEEDDTELWSEAFERAFRAV